MKTVIDLDDEVLSLAILDTQTVEIFYSVLPHSRRNGMATRAARLFADWAHTPGYTNIHLATFVDNAASQRTATRAGFTTAGRTTLFAPSKDGHTSSSGGDSSRRDIAEPP